MAEGSVGLTDCFKKAITNRCWKFGSFDQVQDSNWLMNRLQMKTQKCVAFLLELCHWLWIYICVCMWCSEWKIFFSRQSCMTCKHGESSIQPKDQTGPNKTSKLIWIFSDYEKTYEFRSVFLIQLPYALLFDTVKYVFNGKHSSWSKIFLIIFY